MLIYFALSYLSCFGTGLPITTLLKKYSQSIWKLKKVFISEHERLTNLKVQRDLCGQQQYDGRDSARDYLSAVTSRSDCSSTQFSTTPSIYERENSRCSSELPQFSQIFSLWEWLFLTKIDWSWILVFFLIVSFVCHEIYVHVYIN